MVYANSFSLPLLLDDRVTILENPQIRDWTSPAVLFPARELPVAGRPLANLAFALNYAAAGAAVEGYHAVNLALHIACALLLFAVIRRTLNLPRVAAWLNPSTTSSPAATGGPPPAVVHRRARGQRRQRHAE